MLLRADTQHEAGDVIMLARVTDESVYIRHHPFQRLVRALWPRSLDAREQARLAIFVSRIINGLDDAVREDEKQIAGLKQDASRGVGQRLVRKQRKSERRTSG